MGGGVGGGGGGGGGNKDPKPLAKPFFFEIFQHLNLFSMRYSNT